MSTDAESASPRATWSRLWLRRYGALIRAAWLVDLQYRADITLWLLWGIIEPGVALGIWWSIAGGADGSVDRYSQLDFARYFFAVALANQLTQSWDAWSIDHWVADGEMNYRLARPVSPVHEAAADNIAYKARTGTVVLLIWLLIAAVWPVARMPIRPGHWLLAAVAMLLGAGIRFFNGFAIGLLAFWTTRATSLIELQMAVGVFLSGQIAPLDLLPPSISAIAHYLWFPYVIAFPVALLTGVGDSESMIVHGFAGQIVWLAIWWLLFRVVWQRGLKRYGAVGG
jgi:ABC-2 type transport system permease protein